MGFYRDTIRTKYIHNNETRLDIPYKDLESFSEEELDDYANFLEHLLMHNNKKRFRYDL